MIQVFVIIIQVPYLAAEVRSDIPLLRIWGSMTVQAPLDPAGAGHKGGPSGKFLTVGGITSQI